MSGDLRTSPWLQSFTGRRIYPFELLPSDVTIEDIAHSLSLQCRFKGHCNFPYSVAQHSLYVSDHLPPELQAWGLLHDAPEVFSGLGDVGRPVKKSIRLFPWDEDYPLDGATLEAHEDRLMLIVAERFNLKVPTADQLKKVKWWDDKILATEKRDVMGGDRAGKWCDLPTPLERKIEELGWRTVEGIFLDRAKELGIK